MAARRILIVEDDADSREALRTLLEVWGHEVTEADGGEAALEAVAARRPDVVLLDLAMPKVNGYDVARQIRALPDGGSLYLVALTGYADDAERSRDAGFDAHVLKPYDPDRLRELVDRASRETARPESA
ncbi:MAG TPA: response regulator [Candidatus Binatia bacterium]|nr:response regulator [Candidatus Binatia bacterium]